MNKKYIFPPFLIFLLLVSCDLPHQPGPMPSEIVETEFEPGLNILGVLRADGEQGSSFININRALTTEEIYSDTILNFSPDVARVRINHAMSGSEYLFSRDTDSSDWGNYVDSTLLVTPGDVFDLEISAPGFPLLTASTSVPTQPELVTSSLSQVENSLHFRIDHDDSAFEYKLYLIFMEHVLEKVVQPEDDEDIVVHWTYDPDLGPPHFLMLSALDENLTRYGNAPISFIPNTYHPDGSTVSGGYGCFGSVAVSWIDLNSTN